MQGHLGGSFGGAGATETLANLGKSFAHGTAVGGFMQKRLQLLGDAPWGDGILEEFRDDFAFGDEVDQGEKTQATNEQAAEDVGQW